MTGKANVRVAGEHDAGGANLMHSHPTHDSDHVQGGQPDPLIHAQPLLVNANQAAAMLSISTRKLWQITNQGDLPCVRIGRAVRYDVADLRKFIVQRKESPR